MASGPGGALPPLGGLSLRPTPARTGEFITVDGGWAYSLNLRGEVEPVTHEEYVPSAELPDGEAYFRVRYKTMIPERERPIHPGGFRYYEVTLYAAATLWRWAKTRYTLPHNREPIWREDWMALHERYDPEGDVPDAVARLPSLYDVVRVVEGTGDQRRVRLEHPPPFGDGCSKRCWEGYVEYYEGPQDQERLVRTVRLTKPWPSESYYEGPPGRERLVREEPGDDSRNVVHFFTGPKGAERKERTEYEDGTIHWYEGPRNKERMLCEERPDGSVAWYRYEEVVRISPTPPPRPPRSPPPGASMFE